MATMRAACVERYGGPEVVQLREVERPRPKKGELLIRVVNTTVNSADWRIRSLEVPRGYGTLMRLAMGFSAPRQPVLGSELAGVVEELGDGVEGFRVGDAVIAVAGMSMGAHAEFKVMSASERVIAKPASLSFQEASALCFGGLTALHYLRALAKVRSGEKLLVIGASGAVGIAALQLAREFGVEATAVCSGGNAELVRRLGARHVIDYTREDLTARSEQYDVILDCVGSVEYGSVRPLLKQGGRLLRIVSSLAGQLTAPFQGRLSGHRVIAGVGTERTEDMRYLAELAAQGKYRPVIDSAFPLERIRDAYTRVESKRKRGSVVLDVSPAPVHPRAERQ
ncbi:NAD(P)-dependent alcohol dehydrogenase [Myxococcus landrumensis]|uniref:NAD(P)-dependent alcohol dehydrogenase n=1 Tax=Myxococcus landrumensis TaxID=2813577 RepID=A0ABX7N0X5_9BACT|nr:NAD(P)-dependent alcohol dehydrogenase [Myxococcus landrumus]QSQ12156.1 NAD(P)-dependent alcohol dehydrogenase [Myxococcus landrumus]